MSGIEILSVSNQWKSLNFLYAKGYNEPAKELIAYASLAMMESTDSQIDLYIDENR